MQIDGPTTVQEVQMAFDAYEHALMTDDVKAMDNLFYDSANTVRYGVGEVLYGTDEIRAFRRSRGGSPQRTLTRVTISSYGDTFAMVNAEFRREGLDRRGRQSQAWVKFGTVWKVVSAHVSLEGSAS